MSEELKLDEFEKLFESFMDVVESTSDEVDEMIKDENTKEETLVKLGVLSTSPFAILRFVQKELGAESTTLEEIIDTAFESLLQALVEAGEVKKELGEMALKEGGEGGSKWVH